jgi:hypothetical protein
LRGATRHSSVSPECISFDRAEFAGGYLAALVAADGMPVARFEALPAFPLGHTSGHLIIGIGERGRPVEPVRLVHQAWVADRHSAKPRGVARTENHRV